MTWRSVGVAALMILLLLGSPLSASAQTSTPPTATDSPVSSTTSAPAPAVTSSASATPTSAPPATATSSPPTSTTPAPTSTPAPTLVVIADSQWSDVQLGLSLLVFSSFVGMVASFRHGRS